MSSVDFHFLGWSLWLGVSELGSCSRCQVFPCPQALTELDAVLCFPSMEGPSEKGLLGPPTQALHHCKPYEGGGDPVQRGCYVPSVKVSVSLGTHSLPGAHTSLVLRKSRAKAARKEALTTGHGHSTRSSQETVTDGLFVNFRRSVTVAWLHLSGPRGSSSEELINGF